MTARKMTDFQLWLRGLVGEGKRWPSYNALARDLGLASTTVHRWKHAEHAVQEEHAERLAGVTGEPLSHLKQMLWDARKARRRDLSGSP